MDDPKVTDAEIVDTPPATDSNAATVLLDLEQTIKNHIADIDKRKAELKQQREMMESALMNDETYRTHTEEAKKAAKVKLKTKFQILQLPANKQLADKIKELAAEVKELDGALSDYLREYQRMSGSSEIETDDGEVREIIYIAKLVKKSSRP
jgi:hypothetical protein